MRSGLMYKNMSSGGGGWVERWVGEWVGRWVAGWVGGWACV